MNKHNVFRLLLIILTCAIFLFEIIVESRSDDFMVFFLDVGQGESTLIRSPEGRYVLIDTGPGKDSLEELGKYFPISENKIDLLILSHFDKDHVGGLELLLKTYNIEQVVYNEDDPDANQNMFKQLKNIPKISVASSSNFKLGCCLIFNWFNEHEQKLDSNDHSLALRLDYNDLNIFFGGDLPSSIEDRLSTKIGDVEVLKVSHHGSKTSTSSLFLENISPEFAVISVGIDNIYDHPHQQVITNLQNKNVEIRRTDIQGTQVLVAALNGFELISTDKCQYYCAYRLYLKNILL